MSIPRFVSSEMASTTSHSWTHHNPSKTSIFAPEGIKPTTHQVCYRREFLSSKRKKGRTCCMYEEKSGPDLAVLGVEASWNFVKTIISGQNG